MKRKAVIMLCLLGSLASAQELDVEVLIQLGADAVDQGLDAVDSPYELDREALAAVPRWDDLVHFWNSVERTLTEGSLEELAWLRPEIEATLGYLEQWPAAAPYADWLRQQVDYFAVAEEVVAAEPALAHRPKPAKTPPPLVLPARPVAPVTPAPGIRKTAARARTAEVWRKRIQQRPLPKQAGRLIPILKEVFREEGVPEALVWLAEVESTLDPQARNPVGAAGLFQFMPPTAQRFGLRTASPDDRLDPEKSARAAARYLRFLHGQFGSWPLALAGYNAGEGRVGRCLKKSGIRSLEAIADDLPVETQLYVPKVAAVIELREGLILEKLSPPSHPQARARMQNISREISKKRFTALARIYSFKPSSSIKEYA